MSGRGAYVKYSDYSPNKKSVRATEMFFILVSRIFISIQLCTVQCGRNPSIFLSLSLSKDIRFEHFQCSQYKKQITKVKYNNDCLFVPF